MRILVADDDPSLRVALRMVLELAGHQVALGASVPEARAQLASSLFDAVLVDAGLDGSGVELWKELSVDSRFRGRSILMTGNLPALGELTGHDDVVGKPFDYDLLLERLSAIGPKSDRA